MSLKLAAATIVRLEKVATDNGFDKELPRQANWLGFASTQAPLKIWFSAGPEFFHAAFSQLNVARALGKVGFPFQVPLPEGAVASLSIGDIPALHTLARRAFQLSRTLPDELLHTFQKATATLPTTTEVERTEIKRVGQHLFRGGLLDYWNGRCAV